MSSALMNGTFLGIPGREDCLGSVKGSILRRFLMNRVAFCIATIFSRGFQRPVVINALLWQAVQASPHMMPGVHAFLSSQMIWYCTLPTFWRSSIRLEPSLKGVATVPP